MKGKLRSLLRACTAFIHSFYSLLSLVILYIIIIIKYQNMKNQVKLLGKIREEKGEIVKSF
jgi:hypothetical protein